VPKTAGSGQARTLSAPQLDALLDAAPSPAWRACWAICRWTGSRISETLALTWGAVHSDQLVFVARTTKTRRTREPVLGPVLAAELKTYRLAWIARHGRSPRNRDLLFPSPSRAQEPLTRAAADLALRQALRALGPNFPSGVSLHTFRRSLATLLAQNGASLMTVRKFTGHQSLSQLQAYIDVSEGDQRAALAAIGG
jgi:integrase/recombinase XerD